MSLEFTSAGAPAAGEPAGSRPYLIARAAAWLEARRHYRREMRQLQAMDAHMLADLGITRASGISGPAALCGRLERDRFKWKQRRLVARSRFFSWSRDRTENRYPLFLITLWSGALFPRRQR